MNELFVFLTDHLRHDLRILQNVLGKTHDDTRFVAHLFIKHLLSVRPGMYKRFLYWHCMTRTIFGTGT